MLVTKTLARSLRFLSRMVVTATLENSLNVVLHSFYSQWVGDITDQNFCH